MAIRHRQPRVIHLGLFFSEDHTFLREYDAKTACQIKPLQPNKSLITVDKFVVPSMLIKAEFRGKFYVKLNVVGILKNGKGSCTR